MSDPELAASIPADVVAAIRAAPTRDQFNIAGKMVLTEQVIKADVITLNDRALATLSLQGSWVAIVARRLLIETSSSKATIARSPVPSEQAAFVLTRMGAVGRDGAPGENGYGFGQHRHGNPGGTGQDGGKGGDGKTTPVPTVFLAAVNVETQQGNPPSQANLMIDLTGIPGGAGGTGGRGGNGGHGHHGDIGRSELLDCKEGAGTGGRGGNPGRGGQGGHAGTGGDGGTVYLIGDLTTLSNMSYFEIRQEPGQPGDRGRPGLQGTAGQGGDGGEKNKHCVGGSRGEGGTDVVGNLGVGEEAAPGVRGTTHRVVFPVATLF